MTDDPKPGSSPTEARKSASERSRQARRYRALLDSIDDGFCVIEVLFDGERPCDYRFLEINRAFAQQTGLHDAAGKRMRELAPQHEDHWFTIYGKVAMTGDSIRFEQHARALEDRWFEVHAFRVDEPALRHVAVLFRDITARVREERSTELLAAVSRDLLRIRREEELAPRLGPKIAAYFRADLCAFGELDETQRLLHLRNCWRAPGMPALAGTRWLDEFVTEAFWRKAREGNTLVVDNVTADPCITDAARLLRSRLASFMAIPLRRAGEWKYALMLFRRRPSEWPAEEIAVAREVAARAWAHLEHLRVDFAVRANEERLRLIVENARDYAIISVDQNRRIATWNIGAERLLGYREEEIIGRTADVIFTPEDRARDAPAAEIQTALRTGHSTDERWHQRKDGTRFWGSGVMTPIRDRRGVACGLLKIMRDQTEAETTRRALEQSREDLLTALEAKEEARAAAVAASQAKDQFLATLSHELRTPLNPILMLASQGAVDPALSDSLRADFDMIRRNTEHEAHLIDELLDITRIAQGKLTLQSVDVDLHDSIRAAFESMAGAAAKRGSAVRLKLAAANAHVTGDPARLRQIFMNLLENAIKFSPKASEIRIETENSADGRKIVARVRDHGIGLTADEITRIFRPFAQGGHAGRSGSANYGGLGLGLAIVEELTTRHGGHITATSDGPDRGASFEVILPVSARPAEGERPGETGEAAAPSGGVRRRILLVEDHAPTRAVLKRILQRQNHHVTAVETRATAVETAAREDFDLLVSDIGLPDGDGYELLATLRSRNRRLQGIALSGFGMESDLRRSAEAGYLVHLVKPISITKLDAAVAEVSAQR
ncbi:MAG TPA: PAS domain S-box protein [Opitutus sp.]|nr:PAS domain S-box protein [Opitutus sp.]